VTMLLAFVHDKPLIVRHCQIAAGLLIQVLTGG